MDTSIAKIHNPDHMEAMSVIDDEITIMEKKIHTQSVLKQLVDFYQGKKETLEFKKKVCCIDIY